MAQKLDQRGSGLRITDTRGGRKSTLFFVVDPYLTFLTVIGSTLFRVCQKTGPLIRILFRDPNNVLLKRKGGGRSQYSPKKKKNQLRGDTVVTRTFMSGTLRPLRGF